MLNLEKVYEFLSQLLFGEQNQPQAQWVKIPVKDPVLDAHEARYRARQMRRESSMYR